NRPLRRRSLIARNSEQASEAILVTLLSEDAGLSSAEAVARLRQFGPNELPAEQQSPSLRIARDILREPMFLLLIATGVIYLLLGSLQEALALMVGVFAIIAIA